MRAATRKQRTLVQETAAKTFYERLSQGAPVTDAELVQLANRIHADLYWLQLHHQIPKAPSYVYVDQYANSELIVFFDRDFDDWLYPF